MPDVCYQLTEVEGSRSPDFVTSLSKLEGRNDPVLVG